MVKLRQPYCSGPGTLMMAERPSKLDQLRTLREAHLSAVARAKAASETEASRSEESAALKKLEQDE